MVCLRKDQRFSENNRENSLSGEKKKPGGTVIGLSGKKSIGGAENKHEDNPRDSKKERGKGSE